jgi:predicted enzyme related to lactoylglutathione lyase
MGLKDNKPVTFVLCVDRHALKSFYVDVLGLEFVNDNGYAAMFRLGGGGMLGLTTVQDWKPGPHTVMGWEVADIRATLANLKAAGVKPMIYEGFGQDIDGIWTSPDGKAHIVWFNDPEGNNLSLTQHN